MSECDDVNLPKDSHMIASEAENADVHTSNGVFSDAIFVKGNLHAVRDKVREGFYSLFPKVRMRSLVWQSFRGVLDEEGREIFGVACCVNCYTCIRYKSVRNGKTSDFGTKNMRDHILNCGTPRKNDRRDSDNQTGCYAYQANSTIPAQANMTIRALLEARNAPDEGIEDGDSVPAVAYCKVENMDEEEILQEIKYRVDSLNHGEEDRRRGPATQRGTDDDSDPPGPLLSPLPVPSRAQDDGSADLHDVFGRHVANEMRNLPNDASRRWARFHIQKTLYEAHSYNDVTYYK